MTGVVATGRVVRLVTVIPGSLAGGRVVSGTGRWVPAALRLVLVAHDCFRGSRDAASLEYWLVGELSV